MTTLIIDILLWGSLIGVGFVAWRQDRTVLTVALRNGGMDFINVVPRIALGVIGSGFIAAIIPSSIIVGGLGPDTGWLGVAMSVLAGAATPGGPVGGFFIGGRLCGRVGPVRVPAGDSVGNSLHARAVCLGPVRSFRPGSISGGCRRDDHRETIRPSALAGSWTRVML